MDIGLNANFDFQLDHRNDMPLVEGREAFEQALRIRLTDYFFDIIGSDVSEAASSLIAVEARRVADDMDQLSSLSNITIEPSEDDPNTISVMVLYDTADDFSFDISE